MRGRRSLIAAACCALFGALAPAAQASWKLDAGFGDGGVVSPPRLSGYEHQTVADALVGPDGEIDLVMSAGGCLYECQRDMRLLRYGADGTLDRGFGEPGRGLLLGSFAPRARGGFALDSEGGIVVANTASREVSVFRFGRDGGFDADFGEAGVARVEFPDEGEPSLFVDGAGRTLISGQHGESVFEARLLPDGALDAGFGFGGVNAVLTNGTGGGPRLPLANGSVIYGLSGGCCGPPHLTRWTADGHPDQPFERAAGEAVASVPVKAGLRPESVSAIVPRGHGKIDVMGSTATFRRSYVLRLLSDGTRDRSFGHSGIKLYGFRFLNTLRVGHGRVLIVSEASREKPLARMLLPSGRLAAGYNGAKGMRLPLVEPADHLIGLRKKRMLFFDAGGRFCRSFCEPQPRLIQLRRSSGKRHRHG